MRFRDTVLWFGILCALATPGVATAIDISGTYHLSVVDTFDNCTFAGQVTFNQSGSSFTGSVALTLLSGGGCPPSVTGNVSGNVSGNMITFGLASGAFGSANFTGAISSDGNFLSGTWDSGDDAHGTWSASRAQAARAPALSSWSLAILALLLGWTGMRRRAAR